MWGGLLNRSRDIMRQGTTCFPDDSPEAKKALARWVVAFARALRIHFQPEVTLESELATILTPKELEMLKASPHRPVKAIHAISQVSQDGAGEGLSYGMPDLQLEHVLSSQACMQPALPVLLFTYTSSALIWTCLCICLSSMQIIQNTRMEPIHQMQMSQNLTFFHDVLGGCERLLRAPIPVSYTR
jgi:predicted membrane chloride channel (bestrophin family)